TSPGGNWEMTAPTPLTARRMLVVLLALIAGTLLPGVTSGALAAGSPSPTVDPANGFPTWYQDSAGNRVAPCIDPADATCALVPSASFDPPQPLASPSNFPDEFFYALADSASVPTPGCGGTAPGRALLRVALEGAFVNGTPAAGDQMVFGRIRVRV